MLSEIDVVLVAARRPQLLELTLRSFRLNLLRHFKVRRLYVNIDPIWGDEEDAAAVRALCGLYFSDVVVSEPESPSFGLAVKTLWSKVEAEWFLHLEDDWCLQRRIDVNRLSRETEDRRVGQVSFWKHSNHHKAWRRGVWMRKFTTSPSLLRATVGQTVAGLLDPNFDPEKQLYDGRNQALVEALSRYRHRVHGSRFSPLCIADIGGDWRRLRGIQKNRSDGISTWSQPTARLDNETSRALVDRFEARLSLSRFLPRV